MQNQIRMSALGQKRGMPRLRPCKWQVGQVRTSRISSDASRRRDVAPAKLHLARVIFQRKWLVAEHCLNHNVASRFGVNRMLCNQVSAFSDDLVSILDDLELFETVVLV